MTVSIKNTVLVLKSFLEASGRFVDVTVGEPFKAPQSMTAAIVLTGTTVPETTLSAPVEERTVTIRVYADAMADPREDTEFLLDDTMSELLTGTSDPSTRRGSPSGTGTRPWTRRSTGSPTWPSR
jgi:hypothetical protein